MTDVITGEDVPCSDRNFSKVNNLRPADQEKDSSHQPAAEMREHSLRNVLSEHVSIGWNGLLYQTRTPRRQELQEFRSCRMKRRVTSMRRRFRLG